MNSSRCLFNAGAALRRVFVPLSLEPTVARRRPHIHTTPYHQFRLEPRRTFLTKKRLGGHKEEKKKYKLGRFPRDDEIDASMVLLKVASSGAGSLSRPQSTRALLHKLDSKVYSLRVIAMPSPDNPEAPPYPICQIVDRRAEALAEKEARKEQRRIDVSTKTVQVNWAIDPHDLGHRMAQMQKFLEKGFEVNVVLMHHKKKSKRNASKEEAADTLADVREAIAEVPGVKETRKQDGAVGETLKLFLKGPPKKGLEVVDEEEGEEYEDEEEEDEVTRLVEEALGKVPS